jgi:hypothetical protein
LDFQDSAGEDSAHRVKDGRLPHVILQAAAHKGHRGLVVVPKHFRLAVVFVFFLDLDGVPDEVEAEEVARVLAATISSFDGEMPRVVRLTVARSITPGVSVRVWMMSLSPSGV